MWDDAQVSGRWAIDERKGRGYNTSSPISFHYPIFFIPSLTRKGHFLDIIFVVFFLSNELDEEYIETNCRSSVIHGLYTLYVGGSERFSNKQVNFVIFKWFFLWVSQSFMSWISGTEIVWFMCIFSVFIGQKCCVHIMCTTDSRIYGIRDMCLWILI